MASTVELICENPNCGMTFSQTLGRANQNKKRGHRVYCSRKCSKEPRMAKLVCENPNCRKTFHRKASEADRNKKAEWHIYCSAQCNLEFSNVQIVCPNSKCGKTFQVRKGKVSANKKLGHHTYCSRKCGNENAHLGMVDVTCTNPDCGKKFQRRQVEINKNPEGPTYCSHKCTGAHLERGRPADEFSPFRDTLRRVRGISVRRDRDFSLTLRQLQEIWEGQGEICAYTGLPMELAKSTTDKPISSMYTASLDRIDSNKWYGLENVHFVCRGANLAKNSFPHTQALAFFSNLKETPGGSERKAGLNINSTQKGPKRRKLDGFAPFRLHRKSIRNGCAKKSLPFIITLQQLKETWDHQEGICIYTGFPMELAESTACGKVGGGSMYAASVDRIDPSRGYTLENIHFVCRAANFAKSAFSHTQALAFFNKLKGT